MNNKYRKYLSSKEWLNTRLDIITTRKKCERCNSTKYLQVHHKTYKNIFKEETGDLELLCGGCHKAEHNIGKVKTKTKKKKVKKSKTRLEMDKSKREASFNNKYY